MNPNHLNAYEVLKEEELQDIHSKGWLLRHKKTGARVMLIENSDENKVFNIAFRTPPKNSTGVAHILEHSVLCGSREFPLKDPFVELVKGSLNTFLNAMTYPDKTCYPVASCNDRDFQNLMHVYLDAVFYPNIYKKEEIFRQEGWNYHLEKKEGPLKYNGVVYNEMKGAFSSPDDVLEREIMNSLFPDTTYGCESGGDPVNIPDLSYEEFLDFHRQYYHPSNSFIYLYGNMDMEEKLEFLDSHYLSAFDSLVIDSEIRNQEAFAQVKDIQKSYPEVGKGNIGVGSTIFAVKPGDGSAREQAASCQKVLGGWANIANEYATKRYRSNLINWGMLPFITEEEHTKLSFRNGDYLFVPDIRKAVEDKASTIKAYVVGDDLKEIDLKLGDLTDAEREIILKGCLINYYRG